jgi:hypothetical protein
VLVEVADEEVRLTVEAGVRNCKWRLVAHHEARVDERLHEFRDPLDRHVGVERRAEEEHLEAEWIVLDAA